MEREREQSGDEQATSVNQPSGRPPEQDTPYDPEMTEGDEANIPPGSDADPEEA